MQKGSGGKLGGNGLRTAAKTRARLVNWASCALLAALSIIFGKYLSISTELFRISFENLTVILAGILLGPLSGAVTGACADIVGSLMVGYTINPIITVGAAATGCVSGAVFILMRRLGALRMRAVYPSVMCGHLLGSVMIKSAGLWWYYKQPIALLAWRVPLYAVIGSAEAYIILLLLSNRGFMSAVSSGLSEKRRDMLRNAAKNKNNKKTEDMSDEQM